MIGLIFFASIVIIFGSIGFATGIFFAAWDKRSGILSSPKRFLWYLLGLVLLFLALFGDEIIGKMQFDALCEKAEFKLLVNESELKGKKLIAYRMERIRMQNTWIPTRSIRYTYKDATSGKNYFLSASYSVSGGWLSNMVRLENDYPLVFADTFCDGPQYIELQKKYNFSVVDTK